MPRFRKTGEFKVKRVLVRNGPFAYHTFRVTGWLNGQRIRRQFSSQAEAMGERDRLAVQAANAAREIRAVNTRLTSAELAEAEASIKRLGKTSLCFAVDWFLENYRPPVTECRLDIAITSFREAKAPHVTALVDRDYRLALDALSTAFPEMKVHEPTTEKIEAYLKAQGLGPKGWNNLRGNLHAFFEWCRMPPRNWRVDNPVAPVQKFKIVRGVPEIMSVDRVVELFAYLETYAGGPRSKAKPGCLVPYFALCTFAGIRPAVPGGEVWKIGNVADPAKIIDLENGVIRIGPDIAKTKDLRQVTIQPNLRAWLERYTLKDYPIIVPNMQAMVTKVRKRFSIGEDVLRHTFVSNHVARFRSLGSTALESGNSERIIKKHYLNLLHPMSSERFWEIVPAPEV